MRVSIDCPHCGKVTRVDLSAEMSTQRCDKCDTRFSAVSTGLAPKRRKRVMTDPFTGRPVHQEWGERGFPTKGWSLSMRLAWVLAGSAFLAICSLVAYLAWRGNQPESAASVPRPGPGMLAGVMDGPLSPPRYESLKSRFSEGMELAKSVLNAATVDELLPYIRQRKHLEKKVREYYEGEGKGTLPIGVASIAPIDRHTWVEKYHLVIISYLSKERFVRAMAFELAPDGSMLVDWPSLVALGEVPLADFLASKETRPRLFRLLGSFDDYYNRDFSNERDYICLKLLDVRKQFLIYGYARRDSEAGLAIKELRLPSGRAFSLPITVRLRFPETSTTPDQLELTDVVTSGWILMTSEEPVGPTASTPTSVTTSASTNLLDPAVTTPLVPGGAPPTLIPGGTPVPEATRPLLPETTPLPFPESPTSPPTRPQPK
jgi:hypothetical protein